MATGLQSATLSTYRNESDHLALLDFKKRISQDPLQIMSSWNTSIHFCSWVGVTCNHANKRVMILNLEAQKLLHGEIPPDVGITLPNLEVFAGGVNKFTGTIPLSLANASRLQVLDFATNDLDLAKEKC
ncbi:hypothetical protein DVH24_014727 [Malus domestica]|uniref:Leucine-rich repeat-containing N-terminal plant-type domain-containing protein n=1 Tax=Malus domestica TaxID=3750 RepID=A0A498K234_MALDO|nr:hypothetical protein DVH24_014727 [Malus domestica]